MFLMFMCIALKEKTHFHGRQDVCASGASRAQGIQLANNSREIDGRSVPGPI